MPGNEQGVLVESREFRKRGAPAGYRRLFVKRDRYQLLNSKSPGVGFILFGNPSEYRCPSVLSMTRAPTVGAFSFVHIAVGKPPVFSFVLVILTGNPSWRFLFPVGGSTA
jgi:hypothetical protein